MEVIKLKILREEMVSRQPDITYGVLTQPFIYINIFISQDVDNMGVFSDIDFISSPTPKINQKSILEDYRPNFLHKTWFKAGSKISTTTDSKLVNLKGYKEKNRYKKGFDTKKETYTNYKNIEIKGVSRITQMDDTQTTYVFDTP